MASLCGANCGECGKKELCKGCAETGGRPLGVDCIIAKCYLDGGETAFFQYKKRLTDEFNALDIPGMPHVTELFPLLGCYVNLEYVLPSGQHVKLLEDNGIYLGCQVEREDSGRCYGLAADDTYLLVCEYGCNGSDPQIVAYKRR